MGLSFHQEPGTGEECYLVPVLAAMQGKGTGLSYFFLLQHTTKRDLSKEAHVKSHLQMSTWPKLVLFCTSRLKVCVLAVSSPPLLLTQASAGICWSYYSCFFYRTPWLCLGLLVRVAVPTLQWEAMMSGWSVPRILTIYRGCQACSIPVGSCFLKYTAPLI